MSHVAARQADKKHCEPVQVKAEEASTEAALLRMMGPRQVKEKFQAAAAAEVLSGGPVASAGPEHAPPPAAAPAQASQAAAGASPAKQSKNRAGDATPGAGTPTKKRPPAATPSPGRSRGGNGGAA